MKKIIGIIICLLLCMGVCCAVDVVNNEISETKVVSGEKTVSLGSVKEEEAKNTLRPDRIQLKENEDDNFYIGDEVEETYGNPLLQMVLSIIIFILVVITIFTIAKKTVG